MKPFAAIAAILLLGVNVAQAALLSEQRARSKAVKVLMGDPYGRTVGEVAKNIKDARLVQDGNTRACGPMHRPAWEFHVVVVTANKDQFNNGVIDGYLALDAQTGEILCTNLPLLD
jgi:hypothetical protein